MSKETTLYQGSGTIINAEIDKQISTAHAYPRAIKKFLSDAIEMATFNEEIAQACFYSLPRRKSLGNGKYEKTFIKGPSIRLAEIIISNYGNIYAQTRLVSNDGKFITAEGVCWDLEKNVKITQQVSRALTLNTPDMIQQTGNAASAIALRNSAFKVIPKVYADQVYAEAVRVAVGDQKTIVKRRKDVFERLRLLGIDQEQVLTFFEKKGIEEFTLEDIENLIGVGTAIKDGVLKIDTAFILTDEMENLNANQRIKHLLKFKGKTELDNGWDEFKKEGE